MKKLQILVPMFFLALCSFAQQKTISGKVVNKKTNEPLGGVSVQAKGKTVLTNTEGVFSVQASPGETINLTFIGMLPLSYKITSSTDNPVLQMEEGVNTLNEVVVTGYKSERKVDLTGAVSVVNLATIKNTTTSSPMLAL